MLKDHVVEAVVCSVYTLAAVERLWICLQDQAQQVSEARHLDVPYALHIYLGMLAAKAITSGAPSNPQNPWVAWCVFDLSRSDLSGGYSVHHLCAKYVESPPLFMVI